MLEKNKRIIEGYIPEKTEKGYQPAKPQGAPIGDPKPQGGYQPTSSGDNPTTTPAPPGDE